MTTEPDPAAGAATAARSASERVRAVVEASEARAGAPRGERPAGQPAGDPRVADRGPAGDPGAADPHAEGAAEPASRDIRALAEQLSASTAAIMARIDALEREVRELREPSGSSPGLSPGSSPEPATASQEDEDEAPVGRSRDADGAKLIALNMALNGTPREETDHYLADHYSLEDRERLLDAVYAQLDV